MGRVSQHLSTIHKQSDPVSIALFAIKRLDQQQFSPSNKTTSEQFKSEKGTHVLKDNASRGSSFGGRRDGKRSPGPS